MRCALIISLLSLFCLGFSATLGSVVEIQCGPYGCPVPSAPQVGVSSERLESSRYVDIPRVRAGSSVGSCIVFYVDRNNGRSFAFTAGHVIPRERNCIVEVEGRQYRARALEVQYTIHSDRDAPLFSLGGALIRQITQVQYQWSPEYAVVEIEGIIERVRAVWDPKSGSSLVGKNAFVVGWARGTSLQFQRGRIIQDDLGILVVSCPAIPGQSGGAVLLDEKDPDTGQNPLVGIISATDGQRTIATPVRFVVSRIENAAWLPWRRQQEEIDRLQNRIAELEAELKKYQLGQVPGGSATPVEVEKRIAVIEAELKALREQLNNHQNAIEALVTSIKELGGKVEKPPVFVPPPQNGVATEDWERFKSEWTWFSRVWVVLVVLFGVWLVFLTLRGKGFVFSSPAAKLVTKMIPGQVDDIIVTLLALGEDKLAAMLGRLFGRSPSTIADLQRKVANTVELVDKLNLKPETGTKRVRKKS